MPHFTQYLLALANERFIYPFCPLGADPFYLPPRVPCTMIININVETQARRKLGIWSTGAGGGDISIGGGLLCCQVETSNIYNEMVQEGKQELLGLIR